MPPPPTPVTCAIAGLVTFLACGSARAAPAPVVVTVTPAMCVFGCNVRIDVRIESDPDNRYLVIETDSADYYRRSDIPLEGDRSASVHTVRLTNAPAGKYEVRAILQRVDGTVRAIPATLTVVGP